MSKSEVERLDDPETFKDALFLSQVGRWSPRDLDEADALLVALVMSLQQAKRG